MPSSNAATPAPLKREIDGPYSLVFGTPNRLATEQPVLHTLITTSVYTRKP